MVDQRNLCSGGMFRSFICWNPFALCHETEWPAGSWDALHSASLSGVKGGLVLVVADDPSAHSSTNEFDSRHQSRSAAVPMLEPANMQEAKEMIRWGFELSEQLQQLVMVRTVTRINHGRSSVTLGQIPQHKQAPAVIGEWDRLVAINWFKDAQIAKIEQADNFEESPLLV